MTMSDPKVNLLVSIDPALLDERAVVDAAIMEVNRLQSAKDGLTFAPAFQDWGTATDPAAEFPDCRFAIVIMPDVLETVTPVSLFPITSLLRTAQKLVRQNSGPPVALYFKRDADRRAASDGDLPHAVMYLRAQVDLNFTIIAPFPSSADLGQRLAELLQSWVGYSRPSSMPPAQTSDDAVLGGPDAESLFALPAGSLLHASAEAHAEARSRTQELLLQELLKLLVAKGLLTGDDLGRLETQVAGAIVAEGHEADRAGMLAIASKLIVGRAEGGRA